VNAPNTDARCRHDPDVRSFASDNDVATFVAAIKEEMAG
jgi:hypothetical protein